MSKLEVDAIEPQSGTTITIGASGDTLTVPSGATLNVVGTLVQSGDSGFTGAVTITTTDNSDTLTLKSTDADANVGPNLILQRDSGSPADGDSIGRIDFDADNDAGQVTSFFSIRSEIEDASDGTEDGQLKIDQMIAGTTATILRFKSTETVFNDDSKDVDFRVESNGNANMLFVDGGNDKVGIGTSTPTSNLSIQTSSGEATADLKTTASDTGVNFHLNGNKTSNGGIGSIIFSNNGDSVAMIRSNRASANDASDMLFYTQATGGSNSERMRIDSSGNVGIGTTSPDDKFHVMRGDSGGTTRGGSVITAENSGNCFVTFLGASTSNCTLFLGDNINNNAGQLDYDHANDSMSFYTNQSEKVRISSAGNVGIGTSSPSAPLAISNGGASGIELHPEIATNTNRITNYNRSGSAYNKFRLDALQQEFYISGSEKMRIDSSGNVGIGTTSPDSKLHVVNTGGQAARIHSDTNNSGDLGMSFLAGLDTPSSSGDCKWVRLADGNDSGKAYIQFKSSSPNAEFAAISDERLKTNIQNTDVVGLDVIKNLRLVKFDWNETATQNAGWSMHGHQKLGFVAQEVEQILPEFISEDTNGFKIMGDSGFVPYLIKAMQEQQTKIQELEARITTLENA